MIYLDTSVLVPLIVHETTTPRARFWRDRLTASQKAQLTLSVWTLTELTSAMGIKVRNRDLSATQAEEALGLFNETVIPAINILELTATDFRLAEAMLREFSLGLRAGDALHLAIASRAGARLVATLDQKLAKTASKFGLSTAVM